MGFAVKYLLDKRWIFDDPVEWHAREVRKIGLYGLFGIFTTAIFWAAETLAWFTWHTSAARYGGALTGLLVGYVVKYTLDRNVTFRARPALHR